MQSFFAGNDTERSTVGLMQKGSADDGDPPLRTVDAHVRKLYSVVSQRRPAFRSIVRKHGNKSVRRYVQEYSCFVYEPLMKQRQQELISVISDETRQRLGDSAADAVGRQLQHYFSVSTMDHCGPQYHPWSLNFNLTASDLFLKHPDPDLTSVITLAFANVSMNNFSFPRGFSFHRATADGLSLVRLPLLPSKCSMHAVFNHCPYTAKDIDHLRTRLKEEGQAGLTASTIDKMNSIIDAVYAHPSVLASASYPEQITKMNALLWKLLYPRTSSVKELHFVYIDQESIVARLLTDHHLSTDTLLARLMLDTGEQTLMELHFNGVHDAFSLEKGTGTYLFWALPQGSEKRVRLWRRGTVLASDDGSFAVDLTSQSIADKLRSKELIPSTLLSLLTLSFYYGLRCFGGLGQVSYLPEMKAAYLRLLEQLRLSEEIAQCTDIPVADLGGEMTVAFLSNSHGKLVLATLPDLLLYGHRDTHRIIEEQARSLRLSESLLPTLPTEYPMLYAQEERDGELMRLTGDDIVMAMRESDRLYACASVHDGELVRQQRLDHCVLGINEHGSRHTEAMEPVAST